MPTGIIGFLKRLWWTFKSLDKIGVFLIDYLGKIKNKDLIYRTRNGLKIAARAGTTDKSEIVLIFSDKEYPKRFFPQNTRPVVIDIGAHIGCFSLYINEELRSKKPKIYSIEPSKENYDYLKKNKTINKVNYNCFNLAISDYNGIGYLDTRKSSDSFSLCKGVSKEKHYYQKCNCMTLEEFCKTQNILSIDLLKIDCEGEEYKIFEKSINFLKEKVKYIFAEVHNLNAKENYIQFEKFVKNNNFSIVYKMFPTVVFLKNLNL